MAFVHAVIEGSMPGFALVDTARSPGSAIVGNLGGFWFALGAPHAGLAMAAVPTFAGRVPPDEPTGLWCSTDGWEALLDPLLPAKQWRYEYHFDRPPKEVPGTPAGMELRTIDSAIAGKFGGGTDPWVVKIWGGPEAFAERSFGVALLREGELVSFCAACAIQADGWDGEAEIEIGTDAAFRRKGLAVITGAAFIAECARRRLRPAWTCAADNEASRRAATRLGFREFRRVPGYVIRAAPAQTTEESEIGAKVPNREIPRSP